MENLWCYTGIEKIRKTVKTDVTKMHIFSINTRNL